MTEIKTFKNLTPQLRGSRHYETFWRVEEEFDTHEFPVMDWDMEVIFTKKVKPPKFKAGDRVNTQDELGWSVAPGTIVGYDDRTPLVVWDVNPTVVQTIWTEDELFLYP